MEVSERLRFFREQKGTTVNKLANLAGSVARTNADFLSWTGTVCGAANKLTTG